MKEEIKQKITKRNFKSEKELRDHINTLKQLIHKYELSTHEHPNEQVKRWNEEVRNILRAEATIQPDLSKENEEIFETVKLVARQVTKADINKQLLDKSTLKLIGLNYSNKDIEAQIRSTRDDILKNQKEERREIVFVVLSFLFFIFVCIFIIYDKIRK